MENGEGRVIPTTGRNNCGGRCLLYAHLREGKIEKMTTRTPADCPGQIPFAACARGLQYHRTFLREDRLRWPMRRVGQRGEGKFVRISWEEAVDEIAAQWARIRDAYGPGSRYVNYATGVSAVFTPSGFAKRLLALDGGYLNSYNSYSSACIDQATRLLYGTDLTFGPDAKAEEFKREAHGAWTSDWRYLATAESQYVDMIGADVPGLALPRAVIDKIYYANARRVFAPRQP